MTHHPILLHKGKLQDGKRPTAQYFFGETGWTLLKSMKVQFIHGEYVTLFPYKKGIILSNRV